eukprot:313980-Alexandrium_andersonii.AAC.1
MDLPICRSIDRSIDRSTYRSVDLSTCRYVDRTVCQSIDTPIDLSIDRPIYPLIHRSIDLSIRLTSGRDNGGTTPSQPRANRGPAAANRGESFGPLSP